MSYWPTRDFAACLAVAVLIIAFVTWIAFVSKWTRNPPEPLVVERCP